MFDNKMNRRILIGTTFTMLLANLPLLSRFSKAEKREISSLDSSDYAYGLVPRKIAQIHLPKGADFQKFADDLHNWIDLNAYDKLKWEFIRTGRLLESKSIKDVSPITFEYTFRSNRDMAEFESELVKRRVFQTQKRLELGYIGHETFVFGITSKA